MNEAKTFGRRVPLQAPAPPPQAAPEPVRPLPTLADLGFTPQDDRAELREFRKGYRHRRFVIRGGWRWIGGLCLTASTITGLLDLGSVSWLLGAAGACAIGWSFLQRRSAPKDA